MQFKKAIPQSWYRSWRCWALLVSVVIIIIVIVVPVAVIVPKHRGGQNTQLTSVIIPLYIYPANDTTWSPLYNAIEMYNNLNFLVVVNPSSGPGNGSIPNPSYIDAITHLNSYSNVKTVGYVRTGYATRNMTEVIDNVHTYAGWSANGNETTNITMHGIFFDESPHQYTPSAVDYMIQIDKTVRSSSGIAGEKTIIHNPGTIPDPEFNATTPDITVVFEDTYSAWQQKETAVKSLFKAQTSYSLMINSMPSMSNSSLSSFLSGLSDISSFLFVTTKTDDIYESFANDWMDFVAQMPKRGTLRK